MMNTQIIAYAAGDCVLSKGSELLIALNHIDLLFMGSEPAVI